MRYKSGYIAAAMACGLLFCAQAFAQESQPLDATDNVPLFSGGVGEEMDYIRSIEHDFNVKLLFTEAKGEFLSDMPVTISDSQGRTVVSTVTKGPVLLVKLPAGAYTVTATDSGVKREQKVHVGAGSLRTYHVTFPAHGE